MINHMDPEEWNELGKAFERGEGYFINLPLAFQCYLKAAEMGSVSGKHNTARCYLKGIGITADLKKYMYWTNQAAEQGSSCQ